MSGPFLIRETTYEERGEIQPLMLEKKYGIENKLT